MDALIVNVAEASKAFFKGSFVGSVRVAITRVEYRGIR